VADVRVTVGGVGGKFPSRVPGTRTGLQLNTFGLDRLAEGINGEIISEILIDAIQPAYEQAKAEWPVLTGASSDSIDVTVTEVGSNYARVALQAGGEKLKEDERNKSGKDYAPYIEYNGTPTTPPGTLTHAMVANEPEMRRMIHASVSELIRDLLV
jgi:hypothetical protein